MQVRSTFVMNAVRTADHERYLSVLYAPSKMRDALFALYAFNAEIASVRDRIHEALPGEVRVQWWRDIIAAGSDTTGTGQPVADALIAAISAYALPKAAFDNYLEARIFDLYDDPMPSRTDLEGYCGETASALIQLSCMVLDPDSASDYAELAGRAGCAQAMTGLIRLLPLHRARGQCFIPADILTAVGSSPQELIAGDGGSAGQRAVEAMIALANEHLAAFKKKAAHIPETLRPAFLPVALSSTYLMKMQGHEASLLRNGVRISAPRRHFVLLQHALRGWRKG